MARGEKVMEDGSLGENPCYFNGLRRYFTEDGGNDAMAVLGEGREAPRSTR
jgi:hypothetical protein